MLRLHQNRGLKGKVFPHLLAGMCDHYFGTKPVILYPIKNITMRKKISSYHLSLFYLRRPLLPLHLTACFVSAFPAAFVFTRSAATVSLSFLSLVSASILSKPLAEVFNRQWHLSPRAVMSPIHQWAMTGCMPPRTPPSDQGRWGGFTL